MQRDIQASHIAALGDLGATVDLSGSWGADSEAHFDAIATSVDAILVALENVGILAKA